MEDHQNLTLIVPSLSQVEHLKPTSTPSTVIHGVPWRLVAVTQEVVSSSQGGKPKTLGVFLKCVLDSPEQIWSVTAHATIKLINQANPEKSYSKVFDHNFSQKSTDWGYSSFMKWKDVIDPAKGFIKDDSIILVSYIKVIRKDIDEGGVVHVPMPNISSVLSCSTCGEEFQAKGKMQPMSLICGHSFCTECLQKSYTACEGGTVKICCSLCNKENTSTTKNDLWFPNYAMIQVLGTGVVLKSKNLCDIHQHEKSYYCYDDCTLVCIYCAYQGDHSQHKCQHVDTAKQQMDSDLQKYRQQVTNVISELERKLLLKTDERQLLQSQQAGVIKAVEDFYAELSIMLTRQKDSLLEELGTLVKGMDSTIEQSISALQDKCSVLQSALKEYTTWQTLSPHEALSKVSTVRSSLQRATGTTLIADTPSKLANITFEMPNFNVLSSLEHLGRLKVESSTSMATVGTLPNGSATHKSLIDSDEPPAKKRKEV